MGASSPQMRERVAWIFFSKRVISSRLAATSACSASISATMACCVYTHTSEAAAGAAVAALPDITGQATVTPALRTAEEMISKAKVRELVETLNHANLKERRTQLLSLVAQSTEQ